jgi:DNA-binding protein HU-beta
MNKSQLVDALADRLGDRRTAATAVDALLQIVVDTVRTGGSVSLAGFGVFESRARAARTGRNPRTGEAVDVPATTVPAFRPGTGFRSAVAADAAPRRSAAPTNGASGRAATTAVNGSSELAAPATATVLTDAAALTSKGKKKPARKGADEATDKGKKKGKKGKK